jgi:hypothetical protein
MGIDFIKKAAKSFKRSWDRGRTELAQPNLFQNNPKLEPSAIAAHPAPGHEFKAADEYVARPSGDKLYLYCGEKCVGEAPHATKDALNAISQAGNVALAKVVKTHPISGTADITLQ